MTEQTERTERSEPQEQTERRPDERTGRTPAGAPFLYVVVCAAGIAAGVGGLVTAARERGWQVGVVASPAALNGFFDIADVEARAGRPLRWAWRTPAEPRPFPAPDAVVVAPATFNTINKWAQGLADTLAVATLCEAVGLGVPVAALPCVTNALAAHPAYRESLDRLRGLGVRFGPPYEGNPGEPFPWTHALDLVGDPPPGTGAT